jgi:hypothetical protein
VLVLALAAASEEAEPDSMSARLDSLERHLPGIQKKALSTLVFGGSDPVSFSGEARAKLQFHTFVDYPAFMHKDRMYLLSGWGGNANLLRLGMVVRPGRNTVLWSKIGFQHTMVGARPDSALESGSRDKQTRTRHDKMNMTATIHEDMSAGLAIRTVPASFWLRMGTVQWVEASPLTIWKAQPRTFAWEYLPYEIEQPIARYYEYTIAKGEKSGRAAWHKKAFNGIHFESINLPADLYLSLLYGTFERFDNFEYEYIDFSNDLAYAEFNTAAKSLGIGDSYRHLFHGRLAATDLFGKLTPGLNLNVVHYRDDVIHSAPANAVFGIDTLYQIRYRERTYVDNGDTITWTDSSEVVDSTRLGFAGKAFYKEPRVVSLDLRGSIGENVTLHTDLALNWTDTTWLDYDTSYTASPSRSRSALHPAFYAKLRREGAVPIETDLAAIAPGFYSPFSFVAPVDAFYAFGANLVGAGKFLGRGEASPYSRNMAGIHLTAEPNLPGYGHLKISYGQHFQLREAQDVLFFPYRLNGMDLHTVFQSSFNRWGNDLVDHSIANRGTRWYRTRDKYQKRLGNESFRTSANLKPAGPFAGGLRSDYLNVYEGFVPYRDSLSARANLHSTTSLYDRTGRLVRYDSAGTPLDTLVHDNAFVPASRKFTFNIGLDAAYDIGPLIGYKRDLFIGGYAAMNGVTTRPAPLVAGDGKDHTLLWSLYLRFEPAIALSDRLYLLGLVGYENWRSRKAWMADEEGEVRRVPIDYVDVAYGLGLDWDMLERVGLHLRARWMEHRDTHFGDNDWATPMVSTEVKMWF